MENEMQEILDQIETITDNGNNSAEKVRGVLRAILEYKGNANTSGEAFEIATNGIIDDQENLNAYHYSFKGTKKQSCSLYLLFSRAPISKGNEDTSTGKLIIQVDENQHEILSHFLPPMESQLPLYYSVPTTNKKNTIVLQIMLVQKDKTFLVMINTSLQPGEVLNTAIALNFKKTNSEPPKASEGDVVHKEFVKILDTVIKRGAVK